MAASKSAGSTRQARITKAFKTAFRPEFATEGDDTVKIRVCAGTTCNASGRAALTDALASALAKRGLSDKVQVVLTGCHGLCQEGPIVVVHPLGVFYPRLKAKDIAEIVETSVVGDGVVERLLYTDPATGAKVALEKDVPFYQRQTPDRARHQRFHRPDLDRRLHRPRRLLGPRQGPRRRRPRGRHRRGRTLGPARPRRRRLPHRQEVALLPRRTPARSTTSSATATRATPARSWTAPCSRTTRTRVVEGMIIAAFAIGARRGLRLRAPRVPARRRAPAARARAGARARAPGRGHPRLGLQLRHPHQPGRRRLRLRRVDGADRLDRGPPRHAARQAHPHRRPRPLGPAHQPQQRRDLRQRALDRRSTAPRRSPRWAPRRARGRRSSRSPARS